jgi:hypothetical protein
MRTVVRFLPLLAIYVLIVLVVGSPQAPFSDAGRYLWFAENLTNGYYSPETKINLWSGPGYPLALVPVAAFDLPHAVAGAMNAGFMFLAVLYFFFTARRYMGGRAATVASYFLGLWPPILRTIPLILTEPLAVLAACGFAFHLSSMHREGTGTRMHVVLAAAYLGYLALTRVIVGYVIPVTLAVLLIVYLIRRYPRLRRDLICCCLALAFCLPYLYYTYSLTGKVYYWGTSGGMSLYWMSSPYKGELGDWHTMRATARDPALSENHSRFFSGLGGLSSVERDDALKQRAIQNIKSHPGKYARNWVANVGRLLFGYPRTQTTPKLRNLIDVVPGMFLTVAAVLLIYPTLRGRGLVPHEIWILLLFGVVYFAESSLVSALHRFMLPIVPFCFLWISFVVTKVIRIEVLR